MDVGGSESPLRQGCTNGERTASALVKALVSARQGHW